MDIKMISPSDLEVLIHYHYSGEAHPRANAPTIVETTVRFLKDGIFTMDTDNPSGYQLTIKGEVWLKHILETPYPILVWKRGDHL
jgi:hypothetical protein